MQLFIIVSYGPLHFCGISWNVFSFLILFIWVFSLITWWIKLKFANLVSLFKEPDLSFAAIFYYLISFYFIYFCPNLHYFLPSINLRICFYLLFLVPWGARFETFLVAFCRHLLLWTSLLELLLWSHKFWYISISICLNVFFDFSFYFFYDPLVFQWHGV